MKKEFLFNFIFFFINILVILLVINYSRGYIFSTSDTKFEKYGNAIINSEPQASKVYLDDNYVGDTPLQLTTLKPRKYKIEIKKEFYHPIISEIYIEENAVSKKDYKLIRTVNDKKILFSSTSLLKTFQSIDKTKLYWIESKPENETLNLGIINFEKSPLQQIISNDGEYEARTFNTLLPYWTSSDSTEIITSKGSSIIVFNGEDKLIAVDSSENNKIYDFTRNIKENLNPQNIVVTRSNKMFFNSGKIIFTKDIKDEQEPSVYGYIDELEQKYEVSNGIPYLVTSDSVILLNGGSKKTVKFPSSSLLNANIYVNLNEDIFVSVPTFIESYIYSNTSGRILNIKEVINVKNIFDSREKILQTISLPERLIKILPTETINYLDISKLVTPSFVSDNQDLIIRVDEKNQIIETYDFNLNKTGTYPITILETNTLAQKFYFTHRGEIIIEIKDLTLNTTNLSYYSY
jgi:hypothetical protein